MKTTLILAISGLASAGQIANPFLQPRQYVQDLSATPTIEGQTECLPPNYPCGNSNICVIVSRGDTCCPESCMYSTTLLIHPFSVNRDRRGASKTDIFPCPLDVCPPFDDGTGSFCLTNNKCCPVVSSSPYTRLRDHDPPLTSSFPGRRSRNLRPP